MLTLTLLAELAPPSSTNSMGWMLGGLAALGAALGGASVLVRHLAGVKPPPAEQTITGQPIRVAAEPSYLDRRDWERDMAAMERRMDAVEIRLEREIGALQKQVASLEESFRGDMRTIHSRIDDLPGQIITILRNTGAIHTHDRKGE